MRIILFRILLLSLLYLIFLLVAFNIWENYLCASLISFGAYFPAQEGETRERLFYVSILTFPLYINNISKRKTRFKRRLINILIFSAISLIAVWTHNILSLFKSGNKIELNDFIYAIKIILPYFIIINIIFQELFILTVKSSKFLFFELE